MAYKAQGGGNIMRKKILFFFISENKIVNLWEKNWNLPE